MSDIVFTNNGLQKKFDLDFDTVNMRLWVIDQIIGGSEPEDIIALVNHTVSEYAINAAQHKLNDDLLGHRDRVEEELEGTDQIEFVAAFCQSYGAAPIHLVDDPHEEDNADS
mgnify:CR=1 FL=1|jgi:hypothetical protein